MSDPKHKDKAGEESQRDIKRMPEYRKFRKLLKQVIKAPPLRKHNIESKREQSGRKEKSHAP
jgi:hypothetical protein